MRLTWRDVATTLLAGVVVVIYAAYLQSWAVPVVNDVRGATLAIGIVGLAMCIVGSNPATIVSKTGYAILMSVLGSGALLLAVLGLVTGWPAVVTFMAIDTLLLYGIATARHAVVALFRLTSECCRVDRACDIWTVPAGPFGRQEGPGGTWSDTPRRRQLSMNTGDGS